MQGLPDHAHEPTLKRISKDTLVIASPAGAAVAQGLGFRNVRTLDHGQEMTLGDGKLRIKATVGVSQHHHSQTAHFCQDRTVSAMKGSACYALPAEFNGCITSWHGHRHGHEAKDVCSCTLRSFYGPDMG